MLSRAGMREAGHRGGTLVFGHASRFNRVAAASHAAAGFVTVESNGKFRVSRSLVESSYDGIDWERRRAADFPGLIRSTPAT